MNGLPDKSHAAHGFIQFLFHTELSVSHTKLPFLNVTTVILYGSDSNVRNQTVDGFFIQTVSVQPYSLNRNSSVAKLIILFNDSELVPMSQTTTSSSELLKKTFHFQLWEKQMN